jgi:hypothetical protein
MLLVKHRVHFLSNAANISAEPLAFAAVAAAGHVTFKSPYRKAAEPLHVMFIL